MIWTDSRKHWVQAGVSLMEMMISLAIFAVIAIPVVMMPLQAVDMSTEARNTGSLNYEVNEFFSDFQHAVNMSYAFMDISQIAASNSVLGLNPARQVFVAYWDPLQNRVIRKGFQFRAIPGFSDRWQLMEADINTDSQIGDFGVNDPIWRVKTKTLQGSQFYLQGDPQFVYCRAGNCDPSIPAVGADGVRVQNGGGTQIVPIRGMPTVVTTSVTAGVVDSSRQMFDRLRFVYRNVQFETPIKYFRLATLQQDISRRLASKQVLPFSMALREWSNNNTWAVDSGGTLIPDLLRTRQHWVAEKGISYQSSTLRVPIEVAADLSGTYWDLPMRDMHYNRLDEVMLVATSSDTTVTDNLRGAYIYRFRPGMIDYRSFTLNMGNGDSYSDPFPLVVHKGDPAWPSAWNGLEFLSVTQDVENNIYVLVQTASGAPDTYWVEKFSANGEYVSRFPLGSRVSPAAGSALGITYNPASPDDVQVLIRSVDSDGHFEIVSYPASQNTDVVNTVVVSAVSPNLSSISLGNGLQWANVRGIEYDGLNNRYVFVFLGAGTGTTNFAQLVSLDAQLQAGVVDRARFVLSIYPPNSDQALLNPVGVAYNPSNNMVYLSTFDTGGGANPSRYYTVLSNVPLNTPR